MSSPSWLAENLRKVGLKTDAKPEDDRPGHSSTDTVPNVETMTVAATTGANARTDTVIAVGVVHGAVGSNVTNVSSEESGGRPRPTTTTMSNQNNDNTPPSSSIQNINIKPNTKGDTERVIAAGIVHGGVCNTYNEVHSRGDMEQVENNIRELKAEQSIKKRTITDEKDEVEKLKLEIKKQEEEVEKSKQQTYTREDIQNRERKICDLNTKVQHHEDEIARLEKDLQGLKNKILDAEKQLEVLKLTAEDTTNAIPDLQEKVRVLMRDLRKSVEDVEAEREKLAELKRSMQKIKDEQAKQKRQFEAVQKENEELKRQIQNLKKDNRELEDAKTAAERKVQELQDAAQEKTTQNKRGNEQENKVSGDLKTRAYQHAGGAAEQHGASTDPSLSLTVPLGDDSSTSDRDDSNQRATPSAATGDDLWRASLHGDLETVRRIVAAGRVDVNYRGGGKSWTPVMVAARRGHRDVFELLVGEGADLSLVDKHGDNILHWACYGGDLETVKLILSRNMVDVNAMNNHGQTAADLARGGRHQRVLDLLVSRGAV